MSYFRDLWGRVDSNHRTHPRTDLQSVAIAAMRLPLHTLALDKKTITLSRQRDLDPRPRDYKSRALPLSYAGNRAKIPWAGRGIWTPDPEITNHVLYRWAMPAFISKNLHKNAHHSFIPKWCAKLQLFYIPTTFFYKFFQKFFKKTVKLLCINT